jgi:hypothetical protein
VSLHVVFLRHTDQISTSELVPVNKRGLYLAMVTGAILPFCPYLLYAQLLSTYHTWRWGIWISLYARVYPLVVIANMCRMWNGLSFIGIAVLYFPKSQTRVRGEAAKAILKEIDYTGGFFSIVGLTLLYANPLQKLVPPSLTKI